MKIRATTLVIIMIAFGITIRDLVIGISGLAKGAPEPVSVNCETGDLCEFEIDSAYKVSSIDKKVRGIFGSRSENYYVTGLNHSPYALMVNLDPEWVSKNFDAHGQATSPIKICGEVREFIDSVKPRMSSNAEKLTQVGVNVSAVLYIESEYQTRYILRLISVALRLSVFVLGFIIVLRFEKTSRAAKLIVIVYAIAVYIAAYVLHHLYAMF